MMFTRSVQNLKNTNEVKKGQRGKNRTPARGEKIDFSLPTANLALPMELSLQARKDSPRSLWFLQQIRQQAPGTCHGLLLAIATPLQLQVTVVFISPVSVGAVTALCLTLLEVPLTAQGAGRARRRARSLGKQLLNARLLTGSRV